MRDLYRPARPVARLLIVALGLLGFVVSPAGTHGGTSPTGTITGARSGTAQPAPPRTRASAKHRPAGRTQASALPVAVRHGSVAPAPAAKPAFPPVADHPSYAVLPAGGAGPRPPSLRVARPVAAHAAPDVAPGGVPRGRAPPTSPRI